MAREVSYMPDEGVDEEQAQGAERREEKAEGAETVAKKPPADTGKRAAAPERAVATRARDGQNGAVGAAAGHAVVIAQPTPVGPALPKVSRRTVLRASFFAGIGAMLLGIVLTMLNSVYPRRVAKFAGKFTVGTLSGLNPGDKLDHLILVPDPNSPLNSLEAKIYLVRLNAEQAARNPGSQEGMIYAFWRKCPHLGCTVPFNPTYTFTDPRNGLTYSGWFKCPCHGSTYGDDGYKVFGPAPRGLDSFALTIDGDNLVVDVGKVTRGADPSDPVAQGARGVLPPSA